MFLSNLLSWIVWDPKRVVFTIPYFNHPVVWYGVLFSLGFLASYVVWSHVFFQESLKQFDLSQEAVVNQHSLEDLCKNHPALFPDKQVTRGNILPLLNKYIKTKILPKEFLNSRILNIKKVVMSYVDSLTTYLLVGLVVGARLGYIFFYGWPEFKAHPADIFKIWEGGLASHGACFGMISALLLFLLKKGKGKIYFSFLSIMDALAIVAGIMSFFIRLGNFVNQEIVGIPTKAPWAIVFMHPLGGEPALARHPVQLYEAFFYLLLAGITYYLWHTGKLRLGRGVLTGVCLSTLFTFRFFIEYLKEHQGVVLGVDSSFKMGQLLSIPFIVLGLFLIVRPYILNKLQYKRSLL